MRLVEYLIVSLRKLEGQRSGGAGKCFQLKPWAPDSKCRGLFTELTSPIKTLNLWRFLKQRPKEGKYYYLKILKAKLLHNNLNRSCFLSITVFNLMLYWFSIYIWRYRDFISITNIHACIHLRVCIQIYGYHLGYHALLISTYYLSSSSHTKKNM